MRLKEIKPGMAVKCRTKEEATVLWTWFFDNGYVRLGMDADGLDNFLRCISDSRYGINKNGNSWGTYGENDEDIEKIEFSDLIIPELTAEEVLQICAEICNESECLVCPFGEEHCFNDKDTDKSGIVAICEKWKSDHEKKEPKIETVDICRIIEILPDGRKRCVHEEDLASGSTDAEIKILVESELKRYCMEHDGEYIAVHEVVSRVKVVE